MKKFILTIFLIVGFSHNALALSVFACEPEWASLVKEIAADKVEVYSATTALQDAHYIQAKPSLIAKIRKSDLVVCSGADLEIGWLPLILRKSGSSKIQEGGANLIYASQYVNTIEKPTRIDRADGDVHPDGNPHIHLNPYNVLKISEVITQRLSDINADNADFYNNNFRVFREKLSAKIKEWEQKARTLNGMTVITNHRNMSYLFEWLKIKTVATLEPKPGIPATSKHLSELSELALRNKVSLIAYAPFESPKPAEWLSKQTGIKSVVMPYTVGGTKDTDNLFSLYENSIDIMLNAMDK